jgi:hypothetical protein
MEFGMVTQIITNEQGEQLYKLVTPDEGKLLYFQGQENEGDGFDNISMNVSCDENELIEK